MTTEAITLYDILVEKGVDKARAREAVDAFVTKEQASNTLVTKVDISELRDELKDEMRNLIKWVAGMLVAQAGVIVTLIELLELG